MTRGERLRARREALGWSHSDVSQRTRIPVAHLKALEADDGSGLPPGPWAERYAATLQELYGLPVDEAPAEVELTHPVRRAGLPLRTVRAMALVSVVALFGALGVQVWQKPSLVPGLEDALAPVPEDADQHLTVQTRRTIRLKVWVDGELAHDAETPGGSKHTFDARDEIVVEVPATDAVRLRYNDEGIVPLGRRNTPRTLRFVDDEAGA